MARPGDLVAGRFRVVREVGRGGMGTVHLATDETTGGPVALKVLHEGVTEPSDRFARESEILASLGHPGIVRYVAHGADGMRPWLAMEWLEGETLAERLRKGPLGLDASLGLVRAAALALGAAHARGVIHRDVKPGNLFLVGGEPADVRVLDFGIARNLAADGTTLTTTGTVLGTASYMAPEQARASRELDARVDVWALGCVLYEVLSGHKAFEHESVVGVLAAVLLEEPRPLAEWVPALPLGVHELVLELLDKDPSGRPRDGEALYRRLASLDARSASRAPAPGGITGRERRVVCVVLAAAPAPLADATVKVEGGWGDGRGGDVEARLRAAAEALGEKAERLADGTLVVALDDTGTPTDQAARAALLALSMQRAAPGVALAAVAGRAEQHGRALVGEVVDRGARLLRRPGGGVALDDDLAGLLDGRFELAATDAGSLLVRMREDADTARTVLGRTLPFVGRDRELATLLSLHDESTSEPVTRIALVSGPPGIGKTRLGSELVRRLPSSRTWLLRGDPLEAAAPLAAATRLVRDVAGIEDGEPIAARREKIVAMTARVGLPRSVAVLLGEIARAPWDDDSLRAVHGDALALGDLVRRAFADWIAAETREAPLLFVVDDLEAIDDASIGLLDAAIRESPRRPLFVVGLHREGERRGAFVDREVTTLALGKLLRRHAVALAAAALGEGVPEERVAALAERSDGSPFFLEEMARAMAAGRGDAPPVSVLAIVEDRLAVLPPTARRLARAASVLSAGARKADLAALVPDLLDGGVDEALRVLEEEEILVRDRSGEAWSFRQALVREAAYAMLTDDDRRLAHSVVAARMVAAPAPDPALVAEHLDRAGKGAEAAVAYVAAAERALTGHDLVGAVTRVDRGLGLASPAERGALLEVRARALRWLGDYPRAFDDAIEAVSALERGSGPWLGAVGSLVSAATALGRGAAVRSTIDVLLSIEPAPDRAGALVVVLARAAALALAGDDDAHRDALRARARAILPEGDALGEAWLAVIDASVALADGDVGAFAIGTERAIAAYDRAGDLRDAVNQRVRLGNAWTLLGAPERAEPVLRHAAEDAGRMGLRLVEGYAWQNLGHALGRSGRHAEARAAIERALAIAAALTDARLEAGARLYLSMVALGESRADLALGEAEAALRLLDGAGPFRAVALGAVATAALATADLVRARSAADEATALVGSEPLEEGDALVELAIADVLAARGESVRAHDRARRAKDRIEVRAGKIADPALRASFLAVPEHRRLIAF